MGNLSENFSLSDFACPCCGGNNVRAELTGKLKQARTIAGFPFKITSGWRCEAHNKAVGGFVKSSHTEGYAVDLACETSSRRFNLLSALQRAGFNRLGIGKTFIHADCDPGKPPNVIWMY